MAEPAPDGLTPLRLLGGLGVLLVCQLAGEAGVALVRSLWPQVNFPGPVAGMFILLCVLLLVRRPAVATIAVGDGLLGVLSLLFVPSAVGIVQHVGLLATWGPQLLLAVLVSTLLTLLVTVATYLLAARWTGDEA
jgi:holin-like protein